MTLVQGGCQVLVMEDDREAKVRDLKLRYAQWLGLCTAGLALLGKEGVLQAGEMDEG